MAGTVVDAHHHVWDLDVRDQAWLQGPGMSALRRSFSADDLRPSATANGVGATVVVQTVPVADETPELLALAERDELVRAVVGWVDLTSASVADDLAALQAAPGGRHLTGIRHLVQDEPVDWLCRTDVRRGLAAVGAADLRYDLLTKPHQLAAAVDTVSALEQVEFVLDHCSKPQIARGELEPWATDLRRLAERPNVTCKLSGLVTEAVPGPTDRATLRPYVDVVLEAFGADRVMFGSDWPVCLLATSYDGWFTTVHELLEQLTDAERSAVLGDTASRVYRLGPSTPHRD
jgi:L-fuconolactonase